VGGSGIETGMHREAKSGMSFQLAVRTASSPGGPMPQYCGLEFLERVNLSNGMPQDRLPE
jgi:hypothetical protein